MDAREFQESGLLYLANRALHPFGVALAVTREEDGNVRDELDIISTDDPDGFVFAEEDEVEARGRFRAWLRERFAS